MKLTFRQKGILNVLRKGKHRLIICFRKGGAMWEKDIEWSQGRTPLNAVTQKDITTLINLGFLRKKLYGFEACLTDKQCDFDIDIPFVSTL